MSLQSIAVFFCNETQLCCRYKSSQSLYIRDYPTPHQKIFYFNPSTNEYRRWSNLNVYDVNVKIDFPYVFATNHILCDYWLLFSNSHLKITSSLSWQNYLTPLSITFKHLSRSNDLGFICSLRTGNTSETGWEKQLSADLWTELCRSCSESYGLVIDLLAFNFINDQHQMILG